MSYQEAIDTRGAEPYTDVQSPAVCSEVDEDPFFLTKEIGENGGISSILLLPAFIAEATKLGVTAIIEAVRNRK